MNGGANKIRCKFSGTTDFLKHYYLLFRIKDQMNFDQGEGEFHIQDSARKLLLPFLEVHFF